MIKIYRYDYEQGEASATFKVDYKEFLPETAKALLEFFTWDYDEEANPIDELMKKYAMIAIREASYNDYNIIPTISEFRGNQW